MTGNERKFMEAAITISRESFADPLGRVPRVGAVAVIGDEKIREAFRGETGPGDHAEYILLEKYLPDRDLTDATIYTTLEPCTKRGKTKEGQDKIPCVERLIDRRVRRVVIGMLDPNPIVRGLGFRKLRQANIRTDIFPHDLMSKVEDINRDFVRAIEGNPIHQITQEIAVLAVNAKHDLQKASTKRALSKTVERLRRIQEGQIPIPDREAGYFHRWLELVESFGQPERVSAYIRIAPYEPKDLLTRNWFTEYYDRLRELVRSKTLSIRYVFLLGARFPDEGTKAFLDSFKDFVEEIRIVDNKGDTLPPEQLRPSIVLFHNQHRAFTHDRGDNTILLEADEWIFEHDFKRLTKRYKTIELASTVFFSRQSPE